MGARIDRDYYSNTKSGIKHNPGKPIEGDKINRVRIWW